MTQQNDTGVTVRYWAGARTAAGTDTEIVPAGSVAQVKQELTRRHPALAPVLAVASLLVDGRAHDGSGSLADGDLLEVLPPFAGG
ncbi:MoaD/ThiS family protein [Dermacoccaceae bacterium W4C1]